MTDMRKKILLLEDRPRYGLIFEQNFGVYLNAETTLLKDKDGYEGIKDQLSEFDALLVRADLQGTKLVAQIKSDLESLKLATPVMVMGEGRVPEFVEVDDTPSVKKVLSGLAKMIDVSPEKMVALKVPDYYPVKAELLQYMVFFPCEIYETEKGKVLFTEDQLADRNKVLDEVKGKEFVFVDSLKRLVFTNSFTEQFLHLKDVLESTEVNVERKLSIVANTMDFLSEELKREGIKEESIKLANACIDAMTDITTKVPGVKEMTEKLFTDQYTGRLVLSQLCIYIAYHMVEYLGWALEEDPNEIIGPVAFYHDLLLETDTDSLIRSNDDLEEAINNGEVFDEKAELIKKHAFMLANMLDKFPGFSKAAIRVIKEHHGSRSGSGFYNDLEKISKFSKIFLVAEEWCHIITGTQGKSDEEVKKSGIEYLKNKFQGEEYRQIISCLEILDAKQLDLVHLTLLESEKEEMDELDTLLSDEEEETEEITKVKSLPPEVEEAYSVVGFYAKRIEAIKVSGENLDEQETSVVKGVTDKINEINTMINGGHEEEDAETRIKGVTDKIKDFNRYVKENKTLLKNAGNKNKERNKSGKTDLMLAAGVGKIPIVKFLLEEAGEDLHAKDRGGKNALHYAVIGNKIDMVDYLCQHGARHSNNDDKRRSPMYYAVQKNYNDIVYKLVEHGAHVTQQSLGGVTLAMIAAFNGNLDLLKFLVEKGVNTKARDSKGKDLTVYAKKGKNAEVLRYLVELKHKGKAA